MTSLSRLGALVLTAALAGLTPLAGVGSPAAHAAAPRPAPTLQLSNVHGHGDPADGGTAVKGSYVVKNRTGARQPATKVWAFLAAPGRSYRLGTTTKTPALRPGDRARVVLGPILTPVRTVAGTYSLRICLTPRPDGPCASSARKVVVQPAQLVADPAGPLDLGDVVTGATGEAQTVTITNAGHARTSTLAVDLYGPDFGEFTVDPGSCVGWLAPGYSCEVQVSFTPVADQPSAGRTAFLHVAGGPTDATTVALGGFAIEPFAIEPAFYSYGDVAVGDTATHTYTLENRTETDAVLTDGVIDDLSAFYFDYVDGENTCLGFVVPAEGSCTFSIAFEPVDLGPASATATFSGPDFSVSTFLTGTGIPGAVRPAARTGTGHYAR